MLARFLAWLTVAIASIGLRSIFSWWDSQSDAPVMHERINKGSDRFFAAEQERRAKEEMNEIRLDFDSD
jgi:hypothetical protein